MDDAKADVVSVNMSTASLEGKDAACVGIFPEEKTCGTCTNRSATVGHLSACWPGGAKKGPDLIGVDVLRSRPVDCPGWQPTVGMKRLAEERMRIAHEMAARFLPVVPEDRGQGFELWLVEGM